MSWVRKFQEVLTSCLKLDILSLMILYYSLVYPFLSSGLIVWGNTYATTLNPDVVSQKKAVQIIMTKWRRRTVGP